MATVMMTPAGWYADPTARHQLRYWDGVGWTPEVCDGGVVSADPLSASAPVAPASPAPPVVAPSPPAAAWPPAAPPPGPGPLAPAPAAAPRHGHAWVWIVVGIVVVVALLAGLLLWAPWSRTTPSVGTGPASGPAPTALTVDAPTVDAVDLAWMRPASDVPPQSYLVTRDGSVIATVSGTKTSFRDDTVSPATTYSYSVTAQWSDHSSPPSQAVLVTTGTPPVAASRLDGTWTVRTKVLKTPGGNVKKGEKDTQSWVFAPTCASGACDVKVTGYLWDHKFKATLDRSGAVYAGTAKAHISHCGIASEKSVRNTLDIRLTVRGAGMDGGVWAADSLDGRIVMSSPYTSAGAWYCPAQSVTLSVNGR